MESSPLEELILSLGDVVATFRESGFADVSAAKMSIDNKLVGFVVDLKGDERWVLRFRDIGAGEYLETVIANVRNFEWIDYVLTPGRFLLYTEMDPVTLCSVRVVRAELTGGEIVNTRIIWKLDSPFSYIDFIELKDAQSIFMSSSSKTMSEVHLVPADCPVAEPVLIQARWSRSLLILR